MRYLPVLALIFAGMFLISCSGDFSGKYNSYPTYPYGGEYDDDYYGGGYDYGPKPPTYDYEPRYADDIEGEWEGFMWEDYRSDNRPHGKKIVAMRVRFSEVTYDYSGRHEWVKVNVLIDGRPVANKIEEIESGGRMDLTSCVNDIDFDMDTRFYSATAVGDIDLWWEEKVEDWWGDKYFIDVHVRGDFELGRAKGSHWAAAWDLFDQYGDDIWTISDETWEFATMEGIQHMLEVEETFFRTPVE